MEYKYLIGLDSKSYEHELDRKFLNLLKGIKWNVIALKGGCFQVTKDSCPELYATLSDVSKTLDIHPMPNLYTEWEYGINGYTTGFGDDTLIVLKSGAIDLLTDEELRFRTYQEWACYISSNGKYVQ